MKSKAHLFGGAMPMLAAAIVGAGLLAPAASALAANSVSHYASIKLISDIPGLVAPGSKPDRDLSNPWGMAFSPTSPFWISDNNTGLATIYNGQGVKQGLIVGIPGGGGQPANPTGQVFNSDSSAFMVTEAGKTGPAAFIFDGEDGGISGWAPGVDTAVAILAIDNSDGGSSTGAVYKGLEMVPGTASGPVLLAANFRSGWIEEYNSSWQLIASLRPRDIGPDFAPFNIRDLNGTIYVTFAKQDAAKHDEVLGPSLGMIETLNLSTGAFADFQSGGKLNAPWGMAIAPPDFGSVGGDLLVGNFGNGDIDAYDAGTGAFRQTLTGANGKKLWIPGLWALAFGNGTATAPADWLYYTSGRFDEEHGVFGYIVQAD